MVALSGARWTEIRSFRGAATQHPAADGGGGTQKFQTRFRPMAFDPSYAAPRQAGVFFERRELERLLRLYGRMVAAGEWRDYGMDGLHDPPAFPVFRRRSDSRLH